MRVTFVLPYAGLAGGIRVLAIYADRLKRRGHQITVISTPPAQQSLPTKIKSLVSGRGWPTGKGAEPSYFGNTSIDCHVLETHRPVMDDDVPNGDIVLATFWKTAAGVSALSQKKGAKAILLQGYETSPGHEDPEIDAVWRMPLQKIVVSKWMVDFSRNRFGDSHVYLIRNSVDTNQFYAPERGQQAIPTIGMLYSNLHLKGVDVCLRALDQLREKNKNFRAIAFGAEEVSRQLPLPSWIEFILRPPQEKLKEIYGVCDVWLCGSRREGFHLPPLEAMACRCPVVSTRVGGPEDVVKEGVNGFLVDIEDSSGLAARLSKVLTLGGDEWRRMSDAAHATATNYSWDDAANLLEKAFRRIVTGIRP